MLTKNEIRSITGEPLDRFLWTPDCSPKGIVQLVHGMAEYMDRYDATAKALNQAGYLVVGHTHLGHGPKGRIKGYFSEKDGWDALIEDTHSVRKSIQEQYPDLPYFLLGHSMGSFVARTYCLKYEEGLSGVVFSGTGHFDKLTVGFAKSLAAVQCLLGMGKKPGKLLEKISSMNNNKGYEDVRTPFDWLSRDRSVGQTYMEDPLCGFPFTVRGYYDMFDGLGRLFPEKTSEMKKEVPVLLLSGEMDPVGGHGAGVHLLETEYRRLGLKDVSVKLYPEGRHEMFNELNRDEVWADLVQWLDSKC